MSISIHRLSLRSSGLIVFESLLIVCGVATSTFLLKGPEGWQAFLSDGGLVKALLVTAVCQLCLYYGDLYDLSGLRDQRDLFVRLLRALGATAIILAAIYSLFPTLIIARGVVLYATGIVVLLVFGWRGAFDWLSTHASPSEKLLIVGTGAAAIGLARELFDRRRELGVEIVGFVASDACPVGTTGLNPGILGTVDDIPSIVRERGVHRVVVSLADARGKLPIDKLLEIKLDHGILFDHLASVYEQYTGKIAIENLRPSWLVFSGGFRKTRQLKATKRLCDLAAAIIGLIILSPVMLIVAALIKITSPGPVLYAQRRVGQHGRLFTIHKFRSMRTDAEAATGAVWARPNDDRITKLGRLLRLTRLDELPQLWNVFKGDMSLIGPRPERPEFVETLTKAIPFYAERHVIRPGLTGWAQVRYSYGASVEDTMEKLQYDLYYLKNMSIALDVVIVFETLKTVILRRGAA